MIAKYTLYNSEDYISQNALDRLETDRIDLKKNTIEVIFYGKKKPYMYEHSIPATVVRSELINSDYREKTVKMILEKAGEVTLILRIEDKKLNDCSLKKCMPSEWSFGSDS